MTTREQKEHDALIVDQFTKQAVPFTQLKGHLDSVQTLIEWSTVASDDLVLDVACGPGLVACEFAKVARRVTGIDITELHGPECGFARDDSGLQTRRGRFDC